MKNDKKNNKNNNNNSTNHNNTIHTNNIHTKMHRNIIDNLAMFGLITAIIIAIITGQLTRTYAVIDICGNSYVIQDITKKEYEQKKECIQYFTKDHGNIPMPYCKEIQQKTEQITQKILNG